MEMELTLRINSRIIDISKISRYGINMGKKEKESKTQTSLVDKVFDFSLKKLLISDKTTSTEKNNKYTGPYLYICFKEGGQMNIREDSGADIYKVKDTLDKLKSVGFINPEFRNPGHPTRIKGSF